MPPERKLSTRKRIAFALISLVALLALLEVAARVAVAPASPTAGVPPKAAGAYRIAVYGGSTAAGFPVKPYGFDRQLEFWLRRLQPGRAVEVINLAKGGAASRTVVETLQQSLAVAPDLAVVLTGHNEFLDRTINANLFEGPGRYWVTLRLVQNLLGKLDGDDRFLPDHLDAFDRHGEAFRATVAAYRANLETIAETARAAGIPLLLCTLPSNLADWPPVYRDLRAGPELMELVQTVERQIGDGQLDAALALSERGAERFEEGAIFSFLEGRVHRLRGDRAAARRAFLEAVDRDPYPWRAISTLNDAVRAAARDGVHVVDLEQAFAETSNGLVGFDLIADNCHPTPRGGALMARRLLETMGERGLLLGGAPQLPALDEQLRVFLEEGTPAREREQLRLGYLLANATYAMKTPFYNFDAAARYLEQAEALRPDDWRVWANKATLSLLQGRIAQGRAELESAVSFKGSALLLEERGFHPYLREALVKTGVRLPAPR